MRPSAADEADNPRLKTRDVVRLVALLPAMARRNTGVWRKRAAGCAGLKQAGIGSHPHAAERRWRYLNDL